VNSAPRKAPQKAPLQVRGHGGWSLPLCVRTVWRACACAASKGASCTYCACTDLSPLSSVYFGKWWSTCCRMGRLWGWLMQNKT
jgi:hypothetical protein